jgi:CRISPR-associated protein Cas6
VTIKIAGADKDPSLLTEPNFQTAARKQLAALGVSDQAELTLPKRRTFRIKHKEVVGYETIIEGLTAEESLGVQEAGLGGRRHMGCGVFEALRADI